jgi:23S rRNA (uracil1939-C5)-methyltransferase
MFKNRKIAKYIAPGRHVHLVGIGGVSMRPLGLVLKGMGMKVTGSDMNASVSTNELIDALSDRGINRVVYISCDADTLARDCVRFRENGYEIGVVTPVDMFPRTGHVENVVCLTRISD